MSGSEHQPGQDELCGIGLVYQVDQLRDAIIGFPKAKLLCKNGEPRPVGKNASISARRQTNATAQAITIDPGSQRFREGGVGLLGQLCQIIRKTHPNRQ